MQDTSKALLSPSDPEATFRYKAGEKNLGYVGNIVEGVGENGSLVMDYAYEQNIYSDSQFLKDYLTTQPVYEEETVLVTDGAYAGESNSHAAADRHIRLITTNLTGNKPDDIYADFQFSEDGRYLLKCVNGQRPTKCAYDSRNERSAAYYPIETCRSCPCRDRCRPRLLKNTALKEVSRKAAARAKQLRYMQSDEFKKYARFRNGVETIPSLMRRKYHVDKIPAHGKKQTRLHFGFKIGALNFQKLLTYINSLGKCAPHQKTA